MPFIENFSLVRRISEIGTLLRSHFCGEEVGNDSFGNHYYRERKRKIGYREKRWVVYEGEPEASKIPAEWHIWLHHTADAPIPLSTRKSWQRPHIPNLTGTPDAWMPPAMEGKDRPKATGDYEPWKPN